MFICEAWKVRPVVEENGEIVAVELQCPKVVSSRRLNKSELEAAGYLQATGWLEGEEGELLPQGLTIEFCQIGKGRKDKLQQTGS